MMIRYRCRADFLRQQTLFSLIDLTVVRPPPPPDIFTGPYNTMMMIMMMMMMMTMMMMMMMIMRTPELRGYPSTEVFYHSHQARRPELILLAAF